VEILVCCVFAYWLVKHLPEVVGEAAQAFAAGLRGEESPAMAARRQRLKDAGVDPATGGAFGQFAGNVWRDFWLDQNNTRTARRADRPSRGSRSRRSVFDRILDAFEDIVERRAEGWRRRRPHGPDYEPEESQQDDDTGRTGDDDWGGWEEPGGDFDPEPRRTERFRHADAPDDGPESSWQPDTEEPLFDTGESPEDPPPVHVDSTIDYPDMGPDDPRPAVDQGPGPDTYRTAPESQTAVPNSGTATAVLELEGPDMTSAVATRGIAVTGVVSGAAETASIARALDAATDQYLAQLANLRARMFAMGESTLGIIQFAGRSDVVTRMAQAAEALAASESAARGCTAEVGPLLQATRSEFVRRNS
jgi:hypothetical protein